MSDKKKEIQKRISELRAENEKSNNHHSENGQSKEVMDKVRSEILKQILKNEKEEKADKMSDIDNHKAIINKKIVEELNFKSKAKGWSIIVMLIISIAIMGNLFVVLYWNPLEFDYKIILGLITATFANLFALIMVVFRYVFSPTKEMLDYNSSLNISREDEN
ncbi:hypothetical protein [Mammaliicoccus sciuri]|uniref:hypothetical protein n=1 Tax=Mammaliicoccus sciuri TaxID=1296 RepID=UPI002B2629CB|nr:hypothetical protein [Mammaliicoccus sciuri]WQK64323.1 hypothetical protein P3U20_05095 [Mammaliicoccus sciuri]